MKNIINTIHYIQNCRIQAFVPGFKAERIEKEVVVGKLYTFHNFTVKDYKEDDKYRCVRMDKQIILTDHTQVTELQEGEAIIEKNVFDFFHLADLKGLSKQNVYLAGTYQL